MPATDTTTTLATGATSDAAARAQSRLAFARSALGDDAASLERASVDAGFRSYWRSLGQPSRILMDAPPGLEDLRPWLAVRELLEQGGVRVPQVLARDLEAGFLLLEDLGANTLLQVIDEANAEAWFEAALDQLLLLQTIAAPADFPRYDEALLRRELRLFDDWLLGRHLGLALDGTLGEALALVQRRLIEAALAQPAVLVHRDFMPRNLMPLVDGGLAVLDFQDAVIGPIGYDLLSLFKDAFRSWPGELVDWGVARYHERAKAAGLPVPLLADFRRDIDFIGVQRHLKVLGIFARLKHRDGKPKYLDDAPRFVRYLLDVVPRHRALQPLQAVLEDALLPGIGALPPR
ncbi:phosphotransferase [Silanimonas sp.]|uniref:aminoglycoside phosphotransferase family protein n=1 Tax=Silanimonas sp. TaxID=1929290 RepID=UPI001BB9BBDC|nr:phosphotransferase [Silanimonas sp.]MBS3896433.1 phosphotransferase [Silanimonas sp.]MBS3924483.1 phosphotransferase [Xanthomonadaceae bacterium]